MTNINGVRIEGGWAKAIGGKGLFLALAIAGAGFQGCTTEDKPTGPAGKEASPATSIREDDKGADLNADGSLVHPDQSIATDSKGALAKVAPNCVDFWTQKNSWERYAYVQNLCTTSVRIRFIWRFGADGACVQVARYGVYSEASTWPSYITEVRSC
jgi:hypothetical protein